MTNMLIRFKPTVIMTKESLLMISLMSRTLIPKWNFTHNAEKKHKA